MTLCRIQRSTNPIYLCSQQGPSLVNNIERDEALVIVNASEMTAELATVLTEEATGVSNAHHIRRPEGDVADVPSYQVTLSLRPREQIPGGRAGHIEQRGRELIQIYDETHITPELATRLAGLTQQAAHYYDLKT